MAVALMMQLKMNVRSLDEKLFSITQSSPPLETALPLFRKYIEEADDFDLFRINPFYFAKNHDLSDSQSIDLFLHATKAGLFILNWRLICPRCGDSVEDFKDLKDVHAHFVCTICRREHDAFLDDYILIDFTIHPAIRPIAYHNPENLPVEDYHYKYHYSREGKIPGGPPFTDWLRTQEKFIAYVNPNEEIRKPVDLEAGYVIGNDFINGREFVFAVSGTKTPDTPSVKTIRLSDNHLEVDENVVASGQNILVVKNQSAQKFPLVMYGMGPDFYTSVFQIDFDPYLTAKRLLVSTAFRELFRSEAIIGSEGLSVKDITVLFTDLRGSTELYERIGDLKAFALVQAHFAQMGKVITSNAGTMVKTIGDAIMAVFSEPAKGVQAALEMLDEIEKFNQNQHRNELVLKIALHRGASIAVTLNDRIDYFGQTINTAARVQGAAHPEEICITQDVFANAGVTVLLEGKKVAAETIQLKGIQEKVLIHRINR